MYNSKLTSFYFNSIIHNNFININLEWLFNNKSNTDTLLVSLNCSPKYYNKKVLIISLLIIEYIIKGPTINLKDAKYNFIFIKTFISKKKVNIKYLLNNAHAFIFLDNFVTDIYWKIYSKNSAITNIINIDLINLSSPIFTIKKLLDLTYFIKNKIKLEKYLFRKAYNFNIVFPIENYLLYLWWVRIIGFNKFIQ